MQPAHNKKDYIRISLAILLILPVVFSFFKPAVWALAVVVCTWKYRQRAIDEGRLLRFLGPGAMTLWAALCLLVPFSLVAGSVTMEAAAVANKFSDPIWRASSMSALQTHTAAFNPILERFGVDTSGTMNKAVSLIGPHIGSYLSIIAGAAGNLIVDSAFFLLFVYLFYSRGAAIALTLRRELPVSAGHCIEAARTAMASSLLGVVVTAMIQGGVGSFGTFISGLPSPLLFFLAMAVASLIPGVGTMLVWGPAAVWLTITGHHLAAIGLASWGFIVVGSVDNFVRPLVSSRFGNLDVMVSTIGSLGGLALFGFTGVILGPTMLAAGMALLVIGATKEPVSDEYSILRRECAE